MITVKKLPISWVHPPIAVSDLPERQSRPSSKLQAVPDVFAFSKRVVYYISEYDNVSL
ncbi:MAG: hypothetical protein ACQEW5_02655 [Bacillota bacterium]